MRPCGQFVRRADFALARASSCVRATWPRCRAFSRRGGREGAGAAERPERAGREHIEGLGPRLPAGLEVESVPVGSEAWIAGRSLAESRPRARTGGTLAA